MTTKNKVIPFIKPSKLGDKVKVYMNSSIVKYGIVTGFYSMVITNTEFATPTGMFREADTLPTECLRLKASKKPFAFEDINYFLPIERVDFNYQA